MQRSLGADMCVRAVKNLPRGAPMRFERVEDVPADLAMTAAVNLQVPFIGHSDRSKTLLALFGSLPWVARQRVGLP